MGLEDKISDTVYDELATLESGIHLSLKANFTRWVIRTAAGTLLFGTLATLFPWGRWILYIWIPLALLSLAVILLAGLSQARLRRKRKRWRARRDNIIEKL